MSMDSTFCGGTSFVITVLTVSLMARNLFNKAVIERILILVKIKIKKLLKDRSGNYDSSGR